jgi:hypothetical protein
MFEMGREQPQSIPTKDRGKRGKKITAAELEAENKARLSQRLSGNTRAAMDPFLSSEQAWLPTAKRRKADLNPIDAPVPTTQSAALVDYDSD